MILRQWSRKPIRAVCPGFKRTATWGNAHPETLMFRMKLLGESFIPSCKAWKALRISAEHQAHPQVIWNLNPYPEGDYWLQEEDLVVGLPGIAIPAWF